MPYDIGREPINMLILLDRSASMSLFEFEGLRFEQVVDDALSEVVTDPKNSGVNFGLAPFPSLQCVQGTVTRASDICYPVDEVTVPIGPDHGASIAQALDTLDTCGGAPLAGSLRWVKSYLENSLTADLLKNPTTIVLAADGVPNCSAGLDIDTCVNTNPDVDLSLSEQCLDDQASKDAA